MARAQAGPEAGVDVTTVHYVAGYGRSGSTALGSVLAHRHEAVNLGEVANVARRELHADVVCSCRLTFAECPFWSGVLSALAHLDQDGAPVLLPIGRFEGLLGLLVPMAALRRVVARRAFAQSMPTVSFRAGALTLAHQSGNGFVDSSKTTRLTANRPRLLRACGLQVDLYEPRRSRAAVTTSYREALVRTGADRNRALAPVVVAVGVALARLAAAWNVALLGAPFHVWAFADIVEEVKGLESTGLPQDHLFGGNRRQLRGNPD